VAENDSDWKKLLVELAWSDIRWAKEQGWKVLQWSIVLLAAVYAASRQLQDIPVGVYILFVVAIGFIAVWYLVDLHTFAKDSRDRFRTLAEGVSELSDVLSPSGFDPDHKLYLAVQILVVSAAAIVLVIELVP
jgi:hypothetical protein